MKVVVTGGSGRLGQHVVDELLAHGHTVLSLDRVPPPVARGPAWVADLTRSGDVYQALAGAQGVVHLAAWQAPGLTADTETFANNVTATYNVLKAATDLGVGHVVLASSIAAYGFIYARELWAPDYLPLDEAHPCKPQDPYGLSKVVGEEIADSFARLGAISIASLRFPGVVFDLSYESLRERWRDPAGRRGGLWTYVDARDAALGCRLAVEADLDGHQVFNVAAPTSNMPQPTTELVQRYWPAPHRLRGGLAGNWSAMDSTLAERVLGYRAAHQWQQYVTPTAAEGAAEGVHRRMKDQALREQLALACRVLFHEGHEHFYFGHLSARAVEVEGIWVKPAGLGLEEVRAADMALIDYDGRKLEGEHNLHQEMPIHTEVYRRRADVQAIVHTHPFHAAALSASKARLEILSQDSLPFAEGVGTYPSAELVMTAEQGQAVAAALGELRAVLMRNHGITVAAGSVEVATVWAAELERSCRTQLAAAQLGPLAPIAADEVVRMYDRFERGYPGRNEAIWRYLVRRAQRAGLG